jgi:hypothetical protein
MDKQRKGRKAVETEKGNVQHEKGRNECRQGNVIGKTGRKKNRTGI